MKSVPENIWLYKDLFHQFPGAQSAPFSTLNSPQGQRSTAAAEQDSISIEANALGKHQFVVDNIVSHKTYILVRIFKKHAKHF